MTGRMRLSLLAVLLTVFALVSCFSTESTLGSPCVENNDCDAGQSCSAEMCVLVDEDESSASGGASSETPVVTPLPDDEPVGEQTSIRFVHAAPDVQAVDVYVAGAERPLATRLEYKEVTPWIMVPAGEAEFELRAAGDASSEEPLISSADLTLEADGRYSILAVGLQEGAEENALRLSAVKEDWAGQLASRARVRLVHAGVDLDQVLVEGLQGPAFALNRFEDSGASGVPIGINGGERIELVDSEQDEALLTSFTLPPLEEGTEVLLVGTGRFSQLAKETDGFGLLAIGPEGALERILQDPKVYTLHGARDAGALENCVNDFELANNISYQDIQSTFVSPGTYRFEIFGYPSGCNGPALNPGGNASPPLEAGERYLLLITGELTPDDAEPAIQVATFRDRFSADDSDGAHVRFVHGASFTQIFVGNVTGENIIVESDVYTAPIAWREESREAFVPTGSYSLGIADANVIPLPEPPLNAIVAFDYEATAGARQWGIVSGDPIVDNENDEPIQLMIVDTSQPEWTVELVDP